MKWSKTLILAAALVTGSTLNAASFSSSDLPESSNWYVHVNLDLMRVSNLGQGIMDETIGEAFADIEGEFGVRFGDDIEAITVFGGELPPERGAVIVHGQINAELREELLDAVERKGGSVMTHDFAGMTYYKIGNAEGENAEVRMRVVDGHAEEVEFDHHADSLYFAFGNQQSMFTQSLERVEMFLESGGQLSGLKSNNPDALVVLQADRAMMQGGLNTAANMGHTDWDSSILSNVDSIAVVLADENGAASFKAEVEAKTAEIAESVRNIIEGLVALKALDVADEPALAELLRATRIDTSGTTILFDLYLDEDLIEALKSEL